jgi:hypothetical protein
MAVTHPPEVQVDFQRATERYIPEDRTLYNYRCENLKSYKMIPSTNVYEGGDCELAHFKRSL